MEELRLTVDKFNKIIDSMLIASGRKYYLEQCERIEKNQGCLSYYGFVMDTLVKRYHELYHEVEGMASKFSRVDLIKNKLWDDVNHFKGHEELERIKDRLEYKRKHRFH